MIRTFVMVKNKLLTHKIKNLYLQKTLPRKSYLNFLLSLDTEDPELLKKLDFVSPKAGVYRPVNPGKGTGRLDIQTGQLVQVGWIYRPVN